MSTFPGARRLTLTISPLAASKSPSCASANAALDAANVYPSPLILLFLAVFTPPASPNARAELR